MSQSNAASEDALALENQFCFALYSTSLAMTKTYKILLEKIGLTYPQYLVMLVLWKKDGVLVKDIGELLMLDSGTLTPLLKRLEVLGLLSRTRDQHDERQVRIALSSEGRQLKRRASTIPSQVLCATGKSQSTLADLRTKLLEVRRDLLAS